MKKTFTLFAFLTIGVLNAQSPSLEAWTVDAAGTTTLIALPNGTVISAGTTTAATATKIKVKFKNLSSANTNSYAVTRTDVYRNTGAKPNFCFGDIGTCYYWLTMESDPGDYSILGPGAATAPGKQLVTDLLEGSMVGYSEIYYKLWNVATGKTGADTLSFTIKYNQILGLNENASILENVSNVYPNPSTNNANIAVVLTDEVPVKVQVYNSLGALVYSGAELHLRGKNNLAVDCSNFNNGLYFITVTAGNSKVTKRLVVNK